MEKKGLIEKNKAQMEKLASNGKIGLKNVFSCFEEKCIVYLSKNRKIVLEECAEIMVVRRFLTYDHCHDLSPPYCLPYELYK